MRWLPRACRLLPEPLRAAAAQVWEVRRALSAASHAAPPPRRRPRRHSAAPPACLPAGQPACPQAPPASRLPTRHRYTEYVVKGEMVNTLCGFPIEHTGGHVAIRHDARMHKENEERRDRIKPWEWWLGDKAYVGCSEFLTEFKKPIGGQLTPEQVRFHHAPTARLHLAHRSPAWHTANLGVTFLRCGNPFPLAPHSVPLALCRTGGVELAPAALPQAAGVIRRPNFASAGTSAASSRHRVAWSPLCLLWRALWLC